VSGGVLQPGPDQSQRTSGLRLVQSKEVTHREPLEEVGGEAVELSLVGHFDTSNRISNEVADVYPRAGGASRVCCWLESWGKLNPSRRS